MAIELLTGKDVASLNSLELPSVMNALLRAEAGSSRVPIPDLDVTLRSTDTGSRTEQEKVTFRQRPCLTPA